MAMSWLGSDNDPLVQATPDEDDLLEWPGVDEAPLPAPTPQEDIAAFDMHRGPGKVRR